MGEDYVNYVQRAHRGGSYKVAPHDNAPEQKTYMVAKYLLVQETGEGLGTGIDEGLAAGVNGSVVTETGTSVGKASFKEREKGSTTGAGGSAGADLDAFVVKDCSAAGTVEAQCCFTSKKTFLNGTERDELFFLRLRNGLDGGEVGERDGLGPVEDTRGDLG